MGQTYTTYNMRHAPLSAAIAAIILASSALSTPLPQQELPNGVDVDGDQDQVTINPSPETNSTVTHLPITATIFTGSPGPKRCRGSVMASLNIPPRPEGAPRTGEQCYNLRAPAGCANFVANKGDGCEARLFSEPNCAAYANTAVFVPEARTVGGIWRSISIECGVPVPDPDSLGAPPLADLLAGAKGSALESAMVVG